MAENKLSLNILLLDDDPEVQTTLGNTILDIGMSKSKVEEQPWRISLGQDEVDVFCKLIENPDEAENALRPIDDAKGLEDVDVILLDNDWHRRGRSARFGLETLKANGWRRGRGPFLAIFTAAATYEPEFVYQALSLGADALISKVEKTHLLNVLVAAVERKRNRIELQKLRKIAGLLPEYDPGLLSKSPVMNQALQDAAFVAIWSKEPVLILGEIGTGKTRLAKAIHKASPRAQGEFVSLDPRQVAESLIQSELFGVERGAFTNALPRKGMIETADHGTLFIDELQNMPKEMQQALLRVIEGLPFHKVGDTRERSVDVRFIFATNVDPKHLVKSESLRDDLLSRISMHIVRLPRLSDRSEDIPQLAEEFAREFYAENLPNSHPPEFSAAAIERLLHADWPYNVRSLRNTIRRTIVRVPGKQVIEAEDLIIEDGDESSPVTQDDVKQVLEVAPRAGSQRAVFDCLLEKMSESVPYESLRKSIGDESLGDSAGNNLTTIVSRLRTRLQSRGFDIVPDSKGYKLVKVA